MNIRPALLGVSAFAVILASCSGTITQMPATASEPTIESSVLPSDALLLDAESDAPTPSAPHIARSRVVKINLPVLVGENGRTRVQTGDTFTLNLFPDVIYTGVIDQIEESGDSYTWTGHLEDIEYSSLIMIFTGGIFIANIASPGGVYEVTNAGGDLYRVVLIDQSKFPGGEDALTPTSTNP